MIRKMNKNEREEEGDKTKRIERDARARSIFVIHNSWGIFLYFHFSLSLSLSLSPREFRATGTLLFI